MDCDTTDYNTTHIYSIENYKVEYYIKRICDEETAWMRFGWNNPRNIRLPNKPFKNNIQKCCRSRLPRRIRNNN